MQQLAAANRVDCRLYADAVDQFIGDVREMEAATSLMFLPPASANAVQRSSRWCKAALGREAGSEGPNQSK